MGGDQLQKDQVLKKVKDHLRRAAGDDPRFGTYWRDDPDFADLRLSNNIDDADITPSIAAPRA
jgi:hypothetical protein